MKKTIHIISGILIIFLIGIVSAESGDTNTEFTLASAQHACVFNPDNTISYWQWWDSDSDTVFKNEIGIPIPPKFGCYSEGGWPSDGCCPREWQCSVENGDQAKCDSFAPDFCSDYNDYGDNAEAYCNGFNINTAIRSIEERTGIEGICGGFYSIPIEIGEVSCEQFTSNCRCYWDADDAEGKCKSKSTSYVFCDGSLSSEGNCTYQTTEKIDDCDETGLLTYFWGAEWIDSEGSEGTRPSWCEAGSRVIDCSTMNLTVFTFWNIIVVVLIIIIIYYFINKRQVRRRKKLGGNENENEKKK